MSRGHSGFDIGCFFAGISRLGWNMNARSKFSQINARVNLWWAGWWPKEYVEKDRYLYDHELVVFTSGKSQVVVGEQSFTCTKGDALIIPPGVRHWTRAFDERVERYCFHFDWVHGLPSVLPPLSLSQPANTSPYVVNSPRNGLSLKCPYTRKAFRSSALFRYCISLWSLTNTSWNPA